MDKERKYYWSKILSGADEILWTSPPCRTRDEAEYWLETAREVFDFPDWCYQKVVSVTYTFEETPPNYGN